MPAPDYVPNRVWQEYPSTATLLHAADLNNIELGLQDASASAHAALAAGNPAKILAGPGIDPTGATASTSAVQAFLDAVPNGSTVIVPDGAVIALNGPVTINRRIRLTGAGELRWTASTGRLLQVNVDGVHLDGVYLTATANIQQYGVYVAANVFRATGCRIVGFRDGIAVAATGEFHDIVIANNQILDIIGSGLGSGNGTNNGESNGDGIVVWGAAATIVGNRVTCKTGSDARIGIHMEGLVGSETSTTYPHRDSLGTIVGNIITGRFRRGIVSEGVAHVTISANVVADATWWGIALIASAHYSLVTGNTIKWTRTAADTQGSSASPARSGIMLYCIQEPLTTVTIANNTVYAAPGTAISNGLILQADASVSSNAAGGVKILGNQFADDSGTMQNGIRISAATTGTEIRGNRVRLFQASGVNVFSGTRVAITDNAVTGDSNSPGIRGIYLDGGAADAQILNNSTQDCQAGIAAYFRSGLLTVNSNSIRNAATGIDLFSSSGAVGTIAVNTYAAITGTKTANVPAGIVVTGNT